MSRVLSLYLNWCHTKCLTHLLNIFLAIELIVTAHSPLRLLCVSTAGRLNVGLMLSACSWNIFRSGYTGDPEGTSHIRILCAIGTSNICNILLDLFYFIIKNLHLQIRNAETSNCLDTLGGKAGQPLGMGYCHGMGGNQVNARQT